MVFVEQSFFLDEKEENLQNHVLGEKIVDYNLNGNVKLAVEYSKFRLEISPAHQQRLRNF